MFFFEREADAREKAEIAPGIKRFGEEGAASHLLVIEEASLEKKG
jgi:hypothetical protein